VVTTDELPGAKLHYWARTSPDGDRVLAPPPMDGLGSGRIAVSETEAPNLFANLGYRGRAVVQSENAAEP
jgi:hypothetical protein